jgi:hypothetical protein
VSSPLSRGARTLCVEGAALVAAVAAIAAFAYAPRAGRAQSLLRDLAIETAENEILGSRLAGQGDVTAEMRTLDETASRFRQARLAPGLRGETSTRIRRVASRLSLAITREGAWTGTPGGDPALTILRKEMTLRGPFRACEAFVAEIESEDEGFVLERLDVRRERPDGDRGAESPGAFVTMEIRLLAIEGRATGEERRRAWEHDRSIPSKEAR